MAKKRINKKKATPKPKTPKAKRPKAKGKSKSNNSSRSFVLGKSTGDILNVDFNEWNQWGERELRQVVSRLADTANKRVKSLQAKGENPPVLGRYTDDKGQVRFSTKDKNFNQLKSEYARLKDFLEDETSSLKGWQEVRQKSIEGLKEKGIDIVSDIKAKLASERPDLSPSSAEYKELLRQKIRDRYDLFWRTYDRVCQVHPSAREGSEKYDVMQMLSDKIIRTTDIDALLQEMLKDATTAYEERQEAMSHDTKGVSGLIDWE